jgi:hypothetical protein
MANDKAKSTRAIVLLPVALKEQVRKLANDEEVSIALITRRALKRYVEQCTAPAK